MGGGGGRSRGKEVCKKKNRRRDKGMGEELFCILHDKQGETSTQTCKLAD